MYHIELLNIWENSLPHIWAEGGLFQTREAAEFQAKQIRKMRRYKYVKVVKQKNPIIGASPYRNGQIGVLQDNSKV